MNPIRILLFFLILLAGLGLQAQDYRAYPMWNSDLPVEVRVSDLVGRLTLEEKVAQMLNRAPAIPRLGIPAYEWWNEILHGVARTPYKVTVYPQAIGMAATWDTASLQLMAHYSAMEGRAINNKAIAENKTGDRYKGLTYWTPNINIFRDPRWGRGQETYGEDPFLTGKMGASFVRGLQGDDPKYLLAAACAKHYAVHSGPEATRHTDNVNPSLHDLWDTYLPAFRELVTKARVAGVMCAYNAINTQPCCSSDLLMNDILRNQWGFSGYVTSDCGAIEDFINYHKTHKDAPAAAADAVFHGTDVECGNSAYKSLVEAVKAGIIPEKQLDISLKRLFTIRYRLGWFDPVEKVPYRQIAESELESPEHGALSLKMARQSIVLLKNEKKTLPLSRSLKKIAVLGPNAASKSALLGNYNGSPSRIVSILDGIRQKLDPATEVVYDQVSEITSDSIAGPAKGAYRTTNMDTLLGRVSDADAIVYVGGISPDLEGEEMDVDAPGFNKGDRTSILLPAVQTKTLQRLYATGKPVILVLLTGSAIALPWEDRHLPAILNAWYGGQSAGTAVADVLFGDYNPAGRLPVTFYKSDADLSSFGDYDMSHRTYRYFGGEVLYPFGYGLSYSTFRYNLLKAPATVGKGSGVKVSATISNNGPMDGEEVLQLYVSYPDAGKGAPIRVLKGFCRIFLKKGERREVSFSLTSADLSLIDAEGHAYQPGGRLLLSIGGGQPDVKGADAGSVIQTTITVRNGK